MTSGSSIAMHDQTCRHILFGQPQYKQCPPHQPTVRGGRRSFRNQTHTLLLFLSLPPTLHVVNRSARRSTNTRSGSLHGAALSTPTPTPPFPALAKCRPLTLFQPSFRVRWWCHSWGNTFGYTRHAHLFLGLSGYIRIVDVRG